MVALFAERPVQSAAPMTACTGRHLQHRKIRQNILYMPVLRILSRMPCNISLQNGRHQQDQIIGLDNIPPAGQMADYVCSLKNRSIRKYRRSSGRFIYCAFPLYYLPMSPAPEVQQLLLLHPGHVILQGLMYYVFLVLSLLSLRACCTRASSNLYWFA